MKSFLIRNFILLLLVFLLLPVKVFSQDVDIVPYLKKVESGRLNEVREELADLKDEYPESPSVMFLEGVLTENGQEAVAIYQKVVDEYPNSNYADAALYRIYSYYYALGLYESAGKKLDQLIKQYPNSPYIKTAKQNRLPEISNLQDENVKTDTTQEVVVQNKVDYSSGEYKFTIQAGAFSKKENAETLMNKFEKSGIYSVIKEKLVAGTTFHVVYVGKFIKREDAESFLQTIKDKFKIEGRVTEIEE